MPCATATRPGTPPAAVPPPAAPAWDVAPVLGAAVRGDPASRAEIVRRYRGLVESIVNGHQLRPADRQDAVQNTWLRFFERGHTIREPGAVGGWLATTARRECHAVLRRAVREELVDAGTVAELPSPASSPEALVVRADEHRELRAAVAGMSGRRADLLVALFADDHVSYAEVSRDLDIPIGSIGPTRARLLRRLRESLVR